MEPTLQKLRPVDYWLHYRLMQATDIERALGGEAQAIEVLKALGDAYERMLRGAEADMPKLIPAAFTGEGMASGFMGLGMGSFVGMLTGGMLTGSASGMSDAQFAELVKAGPIKLDTRGGKAELQFSEDGSLSQSIEFEVNEGGINGKVKLKTRMEACPDPQGKVMLDVDVDSQMSVSGKPGTGGYLRSQFKYERYLDDDAHLIEGADGGASTLHIQMGNVENFESQRLDFTTGSERGVKPVFESHAAEGFSIYRPEEGERTQQLLQSARQLLTLMAELVGGGASQQAPWCACCSGGRHGSPRAMRRSGSNPEARPFRACCHARGSTRSTGRWLQATTSPRRHRPPALPHALHFAAWRPASRRQIPVVLRPVPVFRPKSSPRLPPGRATPPDSA